MKKIAVLSCLFYLILSPGVNANPISCLPGHVQGEEIIEKVEYNVESQASPWYYDNILGFYGWTRLVEWKCSTTVTVITRCYNNWWDRLWNINPYNECKSDSFTISTVYTEQTLWNCTATDPPSTTLPASRKLKYRNPSGAYVDMANSHTHAFGNLAATIGYPGEHNTAIGTPKVYANILADYGNSILSSTGPFDSIAYYGSIITPFINRPDTFFSKMSVSLQAIGGQLVAGIPTNPQPFYDMASHLFNYANYPVLDTAQRHAQAKVHLVAASQKMNDIGILVATGFPNDSLKISLLVEIDAFRQHLTNYCETYIQHSFNTAIPTLSEWGIILLILLFAAMTMRVIYQRSTVWALQGTLDRRTQVATILFDTNVYLKVFALLFGVATLAIMLVFIFSGTVSVTDTLGTLTACAIIAYMLHLFLLNKNRNA